MDTEKIELTLEEKIDRARKGRTQTWIVTELNTHLPDGEKMNEVKFSRKKKGHETFTENELKVLSIVLETEF